MKKRIYLSFLALILMCSLLISVSISLIYYVGKSTAILPAVVAVTAVVLTLAGLAARKLTDVILRPLRDIDLEGENATVYDELLPFVKKINRQKREELEQLAALQYRADTVEAITENMKEGLILVDKNGTVLTANKSVQEIFPESHMAQKNILHICRETQFLWGIKRCLSGANLELNLERGKKIYNVYLSPVRDSNGINGAVILFLDATERYGAEKQRREFSANVSHELKTPLTTISALSEMIENGMAREEDVKAFAGKITVQTRRLIDIIDDIIRLSEFDEGKLAREYTAFDLYELAEVVAGGLREKAEEKRVCVRLAGERLQVTANRRMVDECLYNLIDNAIKYNKEGGSVTVGMSRKNGLCKISVADTGIGIAQEHLGRVFERFYRVDKSRSKKTGGTGLGLSIVKHIAEYHGGTVEMESAENEGTTITCLLRI